MTYGGGTFLKIIGFVLFLFLSFDPYSIVFYSLRLEAIIKMHSNFSYVFMKRGNRDKYYHQSKLEILFRSF